MVTRKCPYARKSDATKLVLVAVAGSTRNAAVQTRPDVSSKAPLTSGSSGPASPYEWLLYAAAAPTQ